MKVFILNNDYYMIISLSIHFILLIQFRVIEELKPIPGVTGHETGYILVAIYCMVDTQRLTTIDTCTFTPNTSLDSPVNLT